MDRRPLRLPGAALPAFAVLVLACFDALAQDVATSELSFPPDAELVQAIAPGGTGSFAITVRNTSATTGFVARSAQINADFFAPPGALAGYSFEAEESATCSVQSDPGSPPEFLRFRVGPLAPDETRTCRYVIRRAAGSTADISISFCRFIFDPTCARFTFFRGTLPDTRLTVTRDIVDPSLLRLTVDNPGPVALESRDVTTSCAEFEGGIFGPVPLDLANDVPGGCPIGNPGLAACLNLTGQNFLNRAFRVGPVPAGGSASCLVRVRSTGLESDGSFALALSPQALAVAGGATALDPDVTNDDTLLGVPASLNGLAVNGAWFEAATSGQGLVLESYPAPPGQGDGQVFGGWYTHTTDGAATRWYSLQGTAPAGARPATLVIYANEGGNFAAGPPTTAVAVGAATLTLFNCNSALLEYRFARDGSSGLIPLQRLVPSFDCAPGQQVPAPVRRGGAWFDPAFSGQGVTVDVSRATATSYTVFAAWYTYTPDGAQVGGGDSQRWYSLQGTWDPATTTLVDVLIFETRGGRLDQVATPAQRTTQVGTGRFDFRDCNSLRLDYAFTAGANAGRSGSLALVRTGPVPSGCQ